MYYTFYFGMIYVKIKFLKLLIISLVSLICLFAASAACADSVISLYVDGEKLAPDVPPVLSNDRTLVPARCIFEKLKAKVTWVESTQQVVVTSGTSTITLKINDYTAYVNNSAVKLDAPPVIMNNRTMIPVRFISENLGYTVNWDDASKSVYITSPGDNGTKPEVKSTCITSVTAVSQGKSRVVTVKADNFVKPKISTAASPQRYILDFGGAYIAGGDSRIAVGDKNITEVRWADHPDYARVVIESPGKATYTCNYYNGYMTVTVTGENISNNQNPPASDGNGTVKVEKPIVVIDAGHGGKDTGAIGYNDAGEAELYEKTANLNIALGVRDYLVQSGVEVVMTRTDDVMLGSTEMEDLLERSRIANDANATFFVSIHNNSFSDPSASGTLVLYTDNDSKTNYGVTSKQLAQNILTPLVSTMGILNRGVTDSPKMVVLRKTTMPSVLIECGFVSSPVDRAILNDSGRIEGIAKAISDGIIKSISQLP